MADIHPLEAAGAFIKEHPAMTVGIVLVAGLGVYILLGGGGGGGQQASASGSGLDDSQFSSLLGYQAQQQQATAAQAAQSDQEGYNLNLAAQQAGAQLALQQETDQTQLAEAGVAAGVTNNANNWNYQATVSGISAQLAGLESNNATSTSIATISANENVAIANTNASVSIDQSDNLEKLGVVQANDNANVAIHAQSAAENSSIFGGLFGLIGALF